MSALQFSVLGPIEVHRGGRSVHLGGPVERALLGALLVRAGSFVSSDVLIDLLWPGEPPATASATLRSHISRLRKRLHPDARPRQRQSILQRVPGGYRLAVAPEAIDSHLFDSLVQEGQEALADGEPRLASVRLRAALGLWRGEPFGDLRYEPFATAAAQRLEERRAVAIELLAAAEIRIGHAADAVSLLRERVSEDPLRESTRSILLEALYRLGRRGEALHEYERAREVLRRELGVEPGIELQELARAIHEGTLPELVPPRRGPILPEPLTGLVGRERELGELTRLAERAGLLTLVGPPGSGKTRLAVEFARQRQSEAGPGAVVWVDLSTAREPRDVPSVLRSAVGVEADAGTPTLAALVASLLPQPPLLVLDNCEHLLEACGEIIAGMIERCPGLTILATSREPLAIAGERTFPVGPLALPRESATELSVVAASPAVQLFVARAAEARPDFRLDDGNAGDIAAIVRRLDGLPLAIELAAVRLRSVAPAELLARLQDQFRILDGAGRSRPPRHRTLRAAVVWSHDLLSEPERVVFRRASVFCGPFELPDAEALCSAPPIAHSDVAGLMARLVDRSMIAVEPGSPTRYRLLETLRGFAAEEARRTERMDELLRRHRDVYLALVERTAPMLRGRGLPVALSRLEVAAPNLTAALRWSLETPGEARMGLRLALGMWRYWMKRGLLDEGLAWLDEALAAASDAPDRERAAGEIHASWLQSLLDAPRAADRAERGATLAEQAGDLALMAWGLVCAALSRARTGEFATARAQAERALPLLADAGDLEGQASAFATLGMAAKYEGRLAEARRWFEEALSGYDRLGDPWDAGWAMVNLSDIAQQSGDFVAAGRLARSALRQFQVSGDGRAIATARLMLGNAALTAEDLRTAEESYRGALRIARRRHDMGLLRDAVEGLAGVALGRGDLEAAARLLGSAARAGRARPSPITDRRRQELHARLLSELGPDRFRQLTGEEVPVREPADGAAATAW